jgi:aspartyl-tRNA(Asn)/glutamyl-tRNA(Gln) amidotransferase subunit A
VGAAARDELAWAGLGRLGDLLRRRAVTSTELTGAFLERLERLGGRFNAVASLLPERALAEARRADRELAAGRDRGPLHGIPYGAKDLLAARGAPTTWGAPPYREQRFERDGTVVRRLGRAGAVLAAKLAMVELAGGGGYRFASASLQGPGRTPWDPERWSGGSSSGSGAAVAAGLVPYAIGSETSGSIVTPASYCGVTGLRPTYGLVSRAGAMPLSWTLDKLGPLARSAADCRLVLAAMAGVDRADPTTVRPPREPPAGRRRPRVGFAPADFEELAAEEARPAFAAALGAFRALDVELVEVALPAGLPYGAAVRTVIAGEAASIFGELIRSGRVDELIDEQQKTALKLTLELPAATYLDAMRARRLIQDAFGALFGRVDALLSVGRPRGATRIDEPVSARPFGAAYEADVDQPNNAALIPAGNLAGLPAVCFPCGFDAAGLPVGLQLVGPAFAEQRLLALAEQFQAATDWHSRRPPGV